MVADQSERSQPDITGREIKPADGVRLRRAAGVAIISAKYSRRDR
jgi:hypothetical protein